MTLHDRLARHFGRARELWSTPVDAVLGRRPEEPAPRPVTPHPASQAAHHAVHLDRRTTLSTRPVANHHPHHDKD